MTPARIRWLAAAAALLVLLFGYLSLNRSVTIRADGREMTFYTRAITVGWVLQDAGIQLGARDKTNPTALSLVGDGMVIEVQRAGRTQLSADGELYEDNSGERRVPVLLAQWGVSLQPGDRILLSGRTISLGEELPPEPFLALELRRGVTVILQADGETLEFVSSARSLGEALAEQGVEMHEADMLQPAAETPLDGQTRAILQRAAPLTLRIGNQRITITSAAATVGEALAQAGISLQGLDYSRPVAEQPLPEDGIIRVVRVLEALSLEQDVLAHTIEWQPDPDAEVGATSVIQVGQDGVSASRIRVRFEDGTEISRVTEGQRVLVEPVVQINGFGSNLVVRTTAVDGIEIEYWATMSFYATSYSPCRSGVEQCLYGTSTSGVSVAKGVVATYKDWLLAARGVSIYIPGYGQGAFYDVGGGFPDGRPWIDLGYSDNDWVGWSQWVTVYFLTPVPANIPYFIYP